MALDAAKWADFATAALKATFTAVLPAGSEVANSLADMARAVFGLQTNASEQVLVQRIKDLNNQITSQLKGFDAFESKVPINEKNLAREVIKNHMEELAIDYAALEAARFDSESLISETESSCRERLRAAGLSESGLEFGVSLHKMVIRQIVALVSALPPFQNELAVRTYLATDQTPGRLEQSLQQIIVPNAREGTRQEVSTFEAEYRSSILRSHGRIHQFGLDEVPLALRWQPLDVTYISLSSGRTIKARELQELAHSADTIRRFEAGHAGSSRPSVERAIAASLSGRSAGKGLRLLISGTAGSGKTTVVKWLAVRCAIEARNDDLFAWDRAMPFLVNLASVIPPGSQQMPGEDAFFQSLASSVLRPGRWLESQLEGGKAVLFFDGLDELSHERQTVGKEWINEISTRYPNCDIVVSSRPEAIDAQFFSSNGFSLIEIQPLTPAQARSCIHQWFNAQCDTASTAIAELYRERQRNLERDISNDINVRDLAGTPLLVAMLCAYYAFGYTSGPVDRVKLITGVITALVHSRDRARGAIPLEMLPFTLERKLQRLGEIAVFLFKSGARTVVYRADAQRSEVEIGDEVLRLLSPGPNLDPSSTTRYLLDRSVVFSALGPQDARFVHALFLEYLAGYQLAQTDGGSDLVALEGLPGWYSVASFFAASASGQQAIEFIRTMVSVQRKRSARDSDFRRMSYCLAECLGAARSYDERLFQEVSELLQASLPPQSAEEVALLASVGPPAIAMLPDPRTLEDAIAYVAVARRVRGEAAMQMLETFSRGEFAKPLTPFLLDAWTAFDASEYASRVLSGLALQGVQVSLETMNCARAFGLLKDVTHLRLGFCEGLKDLSFLPPTPSLLYLDLAMSRHLSSLEGIQNCPSIRKLRLPASAQISELQPVSPLSNLRELFMDNASSVDSLSPLANLPSLRSIVVRWLSGELLRDLTSGFEDLRHLVCEGSNISLSFLRGLPNLESLRVTSALSGAVKETEVIENLTALRRLEISAGPATGTIVLPDGSELRHLIISGPLNLDRKSLNRQKSLRYCSFRGPISLHDSDSSNAWHRVEMNDLLHFKENALLATLEILDNPGLYSAEGIDRLSGIRKLSLASTAITKVYGSKWSIESCKNLEQVNLDGCADLSDLDPLARVPRLATVSLHGSASPEAVEALIHARPELRVSYDPWMWHQETG
ncbi:MULTISPECIES: NACHT domain-containing protein [unclassified Arthrobacter]|uniref:NACHT domain-containing protein n=1 Tax=unclassified Arthrobacter TaxID=235627 RepID=UPI0028830747|nr:MULTISPECIES: NACHT domain-containing protein [unclassified Arthrobacter]